MQLQASERAHSRLGEVGIASTSALCVCVCVCVSFMCECTTEWLTDRLFWSTEEERKSCSHSAHHFSNISSVSRGSVWPAYTRSICIFKRTLYHHRFGSYWFVASVYLNWPAAVRVSLNRHQFILYESWFLLRNRLFLNGVRGARADHYVFVLFRLNICANAC